MTTAETELPALSAATTLMPIRLGDIERGTVAVSRPERIVVRSATNGEFAFLRAEMVPPATPESASERWTEIVRRLTGTRSISGGVPSTSITRSTRLTLLAASSAIVVHRVAAVGDRR